MMNKKIFVIILSIISVLLGIYAYQVAQKPKTQLSARPDGGDFTLKKKNGIFQLNNYKGKVVVIYFGYTFCPDICPTTLTTISTSLRQLDKQEIEMVQPLFISIDPERDTLNKIEEYVQFFHPKLIGVTGSPSSLRNITKLYGVSYKKHYPQEGEAFYVVDHSTQSFILDKLGKIVEIVPHGASSDEILKLIRKYLN